MNMILSPAKINIGLWVTGKRPDGYHDIFTFMHTINLYDRIFIKPSSRTTIKTSMSDPELEDEKNIIFRAIVEFENYTGLREEFEIFVEKNIPLGAGLGGGSSNAAAVIKFLNDYFEHPLSENELAEVARKVGADVTFFLKGGFALAEGIGDRITPLENPEKLDIFIVYPDIKSNTKTVYSNVKIHQLTERSKLDIIYNLQREYGIKKLLDVAENTLGDVARQIYPQVDEVYRFLESQGLKPHVSGSGSSVYCVGKPTPGIEMACRAREWEIIEAKLA